jgi:epoxyqueuosine reductase
MNYHEGTQPVAGPRVSRYAWGTSDYHTLLKTRLAPVAEALRQRLPSAKTRIVVDSAPLLERDFGRMAGLGWYGKNTMLINRRFGSWFFLGTILTDAQLHFDAPEEQQYCGTCTRCLDACPTQAFPEPGVLDAGRCISYLTIEQRRKAIPHELRSGIGEWIFGCDVCQDVCPWNRFAPSQAPEEFHPREALHPVDGRALLRMTAEEFSGLFSATPLARTGYAAMRRNVALALGNLRDVSAEPELLQALSDESAIVRSAAAWALCQLATAAGFVAVRQQLIREQDASVQGDMSVSLLAAGEMVPEYRSDVALAPPGVCDDGNCGAATSAAHVPDA